VLPDKPLSFREMQEHLEVIFDGEPIPLAEAMDKALDDAVKAAVNNNKAASVTVKLTVKQGRANELQVDADLTTKEPKPKPLPGQFFIDSRGRVFLEDPKQPKLGLVTPIEGAKP
jgi:hypothetical protein